MNETDGPLIDRNRSANAGVLEVTVDNQSARLSPFRAPCEASG